jgi:hypothetical protein
MMQPDVGLTNELADGERAQKRIEVVFSHAKVIKLLCQAPCFGENMSTIQSAQEILRRLRELPDGSRWMRLTDEDWRLLKAAVDQKPYLLLNVNPVALGQLLPMLTAIVDAKQQEPEPAAASAPQPPANGTPASASGGAAPPSA